MWMYEPIPNNPEDILEEIRKIAPEIAEMLEAGAGADVVLPYLEKEYPLFKAKELSDARVGGEGVE